MAIQQGIAQQKALERAATVALLALVASPVRLALVDVSALLPLVASPATLLPLVDAFALAAPPAFMLLVTVTDSGAPSGTPLSASALLNITLSAVAGYQPNPTSNTRAQCCTFRAANNVTVLAGYGYGGASPRAPLCARIHNSDTAVSSACARTGTAPWLRQRCSVSG